MQDSAMQTICWKNICR